MDPFADIDLDAEALWFEGAWCTREDLALRIKQLVEAGDSRVGRLSEALQRLEGALARTHLVATRVPAELAAALAVAARQAGRSMGHLVREAMAYYLAAAATYAAQKAPPPSAGVDASAGAAGDEALLGKKMG
ncbi:MAG TPA: ribbon-helix-helix protein, CopG family [Anaeromyxobacteraceae bacterium]|nr:ribbon-helix-helix protein, CopG family [Anaeromyxobacteraceae bacterium]